ncbi:hypothetical protein J6590_098056 [Homalodisca vitripennis]|nr:hypothetical protein J6590_098056 [Homalodisca vitripennis]
MECSSLIGLDRVVVNRSSVYKPQLCLLQYQIFLPRNIRLLLTWARKGPASTWPSSATTRLSISRWTASTTRT